MSVDFHPFTKYLANVTEEDHTVPLKKSKDPVGFDAIKLEAEENGINIARAADGTYTASRVGGPEVEDYLDPRQMLDDVLALIEMDDSEGLFSYRDDEMGGAVVVAKGKEFEAPFYAQALAKAKEHVLSEDAVGREPARKTRTRKAPEPEAVSAPEPVTETAVEPVRPHGNGGTAVSPIDALSVLSDAMLDIARILTEAAGKARSGETLVPFTAGDFQEDDVPAGKSRIRRERGK